MALPPFEKVEFSQLTPVACPCGWARRAFTHCVDFPATIHVTEITLDAQTHFHQTTTECYYILNCDPGAKMQLNSEVVELVPGTAILIRPGTRHRAIGKMQVLIVAIPKFDPADEWLDAVAPH